MSDREALGRLVREVWVECARELPGPKPSHLLPWDDLDDWNKEVDRRIGERVAAAGQERIRELEAALYDVLAHFTEHGHPGYEAVRTGWQPAERVLRWRVILHQPQRDGDD